jgi:hypothetical protein
MCPPNHPATQSQPTEPLKQRAGPLLAVKLPRLGLSACFRSVVSFARQASLAPGPAKAEAEAGQRPAHPRTGCEVFGWMAMQAPVAKQHLRRPLVRSRLPMRQSSLRDGRSCPIGRTCPISAAVGHRCCAQMAADRTRAHPTRSETRRGPGGEDPEVSLRALRRMPRMPPSPRPAVGRHRQRSAAGASGRPGHQTPRSGLGQDRRHRPLWSVSANRPRRRTRRCPLGAGGVWADETR